MILGIDLGTTNSLIGYFDNEIKLIKNKFGEFMTPSVVSINDAGEIIVGKLAKERIHTHPKLTTKLFKRYMGENKEIKLGNEMFTPVQLSSFIIKELINSVQLELGEVDIEGLIISVPAYFNENQRYATKLAGELLGYKVIRIISEPSAAALYSHYLLSSEEEAFYAVIDLGGGTFDVTIVEYCDKIFEMRSTSGDTKLGGEDYTNVLVDMFLKKYPKEDRNEVYIACEEAKKHFKNESDVIKIEVNKSQLLVPFGVYYHGCFELNSRAGLVVSRAINDSMLNPNNLSKVVFVGGGSKSFIFRKFIYECFNSSKSNEIFYLDDDSHLNVINGIVFFSGMYSNNSLLNEYILTDICPFSLGVDTAALDEAGNYLGYLRFDPLIQRNSVLPKSASKIYVPLFESQESIKFNVYQGESFDPKKNLLLKSITLPVTPYKNESYKVTFLYDINSILQVKIQNLITEKVWIENIHHNKSINDDELETLSRSLESYEFINEEKERYEYYTSKLYYIYENESIDKRDYCEYLINKYNSEYNGRRSKIVLNRIEKEIENFISENESITYASNYII